MGKSKTFFVLFFCLIFFGGCSAKKNISTEQTIEIPYGSVVGCYVHKDYVACKLSSNNTYYVSTETYQKVLSEKTVWDCTMWKENPC